MRRPGLRNVLVLAFVAICLKCDSASAQATKPAQQPLYLPDPTPRPPDLERQYGSDPAELARQEQLTALRAAQLRLQVVQATDKLLQLAQELKAEVNQHENGTLMTLQITKAEQIEKLAKSVKEKTKAQ
jgi:hypothetical protein